MGSPRYRSPSIRPRRGVERSALCALTVVAAGLSAVSAHAADPSAADKETSRTLYAEGMRLLDAGEYAGAERACRGAHALVQAPTSAACWARGLEGLGRLVEARDAFLEAARYPESPTEPAVFTSARELSRVEADRLAARIPTIVLAISGVADDSGLIATIDDAPIAADTIRLPRKLDPGRHVIVIGKGAKTVHLEVNAIEGREQLVAVDLHGSDDAAVPAIAPSARSDRRALPWYGYASFGAGLVGLAAGVATGLAAGAKDGALVRECSGNVCPPSAQGDLDSFHALKAMSLVGYAVGLAGLAGGATVWLTLPGVPRNTAQVWLSPSQAGVAGSF